MVRDEAVSLDAGVDAGDGFEGSDAGFYEERHEPKLDAVLGDEVLLELLSQRDDLTHVALVEGG